MSAPQLTDCGVVVTRPVHQASELVAAIETAGGSAFHYPAFDVCGRAADEVEAELAASAPADLVIYVSANAVYHGSRAVHAAYPEARNAVIGPATAAALKSGGGINTAICPEAGFTSEALLADPALSDVAGKSVTIVRGEAGRELLAETLADRGAVVRYLPVYTTQTHTFQEHEVESLRRAQGRGAVDALIVLSVATYDHLERALPADCLQGFSNKRLVAPAGRVIQTLAERLPDATCVASPGPDPQSLVGALIQSLQDNP